jgi:hypothetical protein
MVYKTAFSFMIMDDNVTVLSMNVLQNQDLFLNITQTPALLLSW